MLVKPPSLDMFAMTRFFIASNMGILVLIGIFLMLNTKEITRSNFFGTFLVLFSMGIFIALSFFYFLYKIRIFKNTENASKKMQQR